MLFGLASTSKSFGETKINDIAFDVPSIIVARVSQQFTAAK
jgi:hypothetical protein